MRGGLLGHAVVADHCVEAAPRVGILGSVVSLKGGWDAALVLRGNNNKKVSSQKASQDSHGDEFSRWKVRKCHYMIKMREKDGIISTLLSLIKTFEEFIHIGSNKDVVLWGLKHGKCYVYVL